MRTSRDSVAFRALEAPPASRPSPDPGMPRLLGRVAVLSLFIGRDGRPWSDAEIARASCLDREGVRLARARGDPLGGAGQPRPGRHLLRRSRPRAAGTWRSPSSPRETLMPPSRRRPLTNALVDTSRTAAQARVPRRRRHVRADQRAGPGRRSGLARPSEMRGALDGHPRSTSDRAARGQPRPLLRPRGEFPGAPASSPVHRPGHRRARAPPPLRRIGQVRGPALRVPPRVGDLARRHAAGLVETRAAAGSTRATAAEIGWTTG